MLNLDKSIYLLPLLHSFLNRQASNGASISYVGQPDIGVLQQLSKHFTCLLDIYVASNSEACSTLDPTYIPLISSQNEYEVKQSLQRDLTPNNTNLLLTIFSEGKLSQKSEYSISIWNFGVDEQVLSEKTFFEIWRNVTPLGALICVLPQEKLQIEKCRRMLDKYLKLIDPSLVMYEKEGVYIAHKPDPKIVTFCNKHLYERVYILGNGPSLTKTDLDLIAGQPTIAMNRIPLIYKKTKWRPTYYLMVSDNVRHDVWGENWIDSVNEAVSNEETKCFIGEPFIDVVNEREKIIPVRSITEFAIGQEGSFSTSAAQFLSKTGTTMNMAFQLAYYMGFQEIVLIGADLNWQTVSSNSADTNHFDPSYGADIPHGERERIRMRNTHAYAYDFFKKAGRDVYNATKDTLVDVYPLVDYDSLAAKNSKIVSEDNDQHQQDRRKEIDAFWQPYVDSGLIKR